MEKYGKASQNYHQILLCGLAKAYHQGKYLKLFSEASYGKGRLDLTYLAFSKVADGDFPTAPKPTPTARPSEKYRTSSE